MVPAEVPIAPADPLVTPKVGAVSVISPTGVLNLVDYSSSSDSPLVSPFLCSDDSEVNSESEPVEQRPERHESLTPSSEFPFAPVVAPPGIRRQPAILVRPSEAIPFGRPYRTHPNGPSIPQSAYVPPVTYQPKFTDNIHLDLGLTPTNDLIENLTKIAALLAQSYKTHLPQTNNQLRTSSNTRNQAIVQNGRVVVQNVQGRQNRVQVNNAREAVGAGNGGENGVVLDEEQLLFISGGHDNTFDDDVDERPVQDLALNVDQVFQADQCDAFDFDVDEAPTVHTMFMTNLSSADPIYDEAGLSYDSDILFEVQDHDSYLDSVGEYHEVQEMQNGVQQNYVVDSNAEYTSDSNIIPYELYVKNNAEHVVQSNVAFVPNDALMMIINDMYEQTAQCLSLNEQNKVVNESLTAKLARYKEQVEIYEKRARFELTEREQNIDEQLRIIIIDRNIKE
ncbi:hypothetical protein Tco_0368758 [Tanacetum coccineum]